MSESISPAFWPGSLEVRLHNVDLSREELAEEAKGWLLFVREECQSTSTPQRRTLVGKWATASQEFRDSYHSRAPACASALAYPAILSSPPRPDKRFLCLPPVDRHTHPRNYVHLVKLLILLYIHQDEWVGVHPFEGLEAGQAPRCHIPEFLASSSSSSSSSTTITLHEVLPALYLAAADFNGLLMTRQGTAVFDVPGHAWFVIDPPGLATGRITIVAFGSNASVRASASRRPWNIGQVMGFMQMGRLVSDIVDSSIGGPPQYNEPLDMDLPILELLESTRQSNRFLHEAYCSRGNRDVWARIIEQSAPGYLELEAQGREVEFQLDHLLEIE
ncbi:hypothetical protein BDV39DRAFT_193490 [Aspergillus sergii]|uniref:Uncharacterized protein n=1 Tax=Aspergillus sergii TaxID=1034303 RepID=A0A5N6X0D6_9EURO|nr:hypothetical protein BDV39DRAFT_193490 [Aspergillus sergii]